MLFNSCRILIRGKAQYVKVVSEPEIILIAGPTASGKSALALELAEKLRGVIVNADSMQVYRDLRIITARPTPKEEARVPHRLYGRIDAAENYSVGRWRTDAAATIDTTKRYGRAAIVVGGTGLYFNALVRGLAAVPPIPDEIREEVRARLESEGINKLHTELMQRDPAAAARLMPGDRARITRALEVVLATGRSLLQWHEEGNAASLDAARAAKIFLSPDRDALMAADRCALRRDGNVRRDRRSAGARRARARSELAGDEGTWRAMAHPSSARRDQPGGSGGRRQTRYPPIHQATGDMVPQPASGICLGRAGEGAGGGRGATARLGEMGGQVSVSGQVPRHATSDRNVQTLLPRPHLV